MPRVHLYAYNLYAEYDRFKEASDGDYVNDHELAAVRDRGPRAWERIYCSLQELERNEYDPGTVPFPALRKGDCIFERTDDGWGNIEIRVLGIITGIDP